MVNYKHTLWQPKNILVTRKYNNQIFLVAKPCGDKNISIATGYDNLLTYLQFSVKFLVTIRYDNQIFSIAKPYDDQKVLVTNSTMTEIILVVLLCAN
jgi:hypothetical protein